MSSRRLPGKVLRPLAGRPLLTHLLNRLGRCREASAVVVATSTDPSDDPVATYCDDFGVRCFRGDLEDTAARLVAAAAWAHFDVLVRVSGDSPLLDPRVVDRAVRIYRRSPR